MHNDKTGALRSCTPTPHTPRDPFARNPVHWCCSSYPMRTPTRCNIGILQCSARHRSTSVRVWRSPTMCWWAAARPCPSAPSMPPVPPRAHLAWHRARRSHRSILASLPRWRAQRLRPLSIQRASSHRDEPPSVVPHPCRQCFHCAITPKLPLTLTRGIRVILTARRGGADSAPGLRLAQLPPQHQSGC